MKNVARIGVLAGLLAACGDSPVGYESRDQYSLSVQQGGQGGVYFLPPLLESTYEGVFAADRQPVVIICAGSPVTPCAEAEAVAEYDMVLDPGEDESQVVHVSMEDEHYHVVWMPKGLDKGPYRIFVTETGVAQAFIDVAFAGGGKGTISEGGITIRAYGADEPRPFNGALPIIFRMEEREPEPEPEPEPEIATGLQAQYFDWSSSATPTFTTTALILERRDYVVDFIDPNGDTDAFRIGQNDHFMARWTGFIVPPTGGVSYRFCVTVDDGVRLWIGGALFIDRWVDQDDTTICSGYWWLSVGFRYPIRLEMYHATGGGAARLYWQTSADAEMQIVPTTVLWPN